MVDETQNILTTIASETKKSLDTEVIYLNINDLTAEANNYADYNEDEVKLSYQLPSIEWLLRSDSVAFENLKEKSYKINGHLYESTSTTLTASSKLSVSIDLKVIPTSIGFVDDNNVFNLFLFIMFIITFLLIFTPIHRVHMSSYEFSRHPPEKNLSKIKTLRYTIDYIKELTSLLNRES